MDERNVAFHEEGRSVPHRLRLFTEMELWRNILCCLLSSCLVLSLLLYLFCGLDVVENLIWNLEKNERGWRWTRSASSFSPSSQS